jgi:hypothetical protein
MDDPEPSSRPALSAHTALPPAARQVRDTCRGGPPVRRAAV